MGWTICLLIKFSSNFHCPWLCRVLSPPYAIYFKTCHWPTPVAWSLPSPLIGWTTLVQKNSSEFVLLFFFARPTFTGSVPRPATQHETRNHCKNSHSTVDKTAMNSDLQDCKSCKSLPGNAGLMHKGLHWGDPVLYCTVLCTVLYGTLFTLVHCYLLNSPLYSRI